MDHLLSNVLLARTLSRTIPDERKLSMICAN
jgi:hypothetical protein